MRAAQLAAATRMAEHCMSFKRFALTILGCLSAYVLGLSFRIQLGQESVVGDVLCEMCFCFGHAMVCVFLYNAWFALKYYNEVHAEATMRTPGPVTQ